jgi:hypothetical protein
LGGEALVKRLATLDELGVAYHLIGHSHGGSVIWHEPPYHSAYKTLDCFLRTGCSLI